MIEEDREAIRRMKADFESIAELAENEYQLHTGFERRMNHYFTVYTAATRTTTNSKKSSDLLGYAVDELLYMDYQEMLTRYLLKYRDLEAPSDAILFTRVLRIWDHYKVLMKWNMRAFAYLSRFFIVNCAKPSLQQVALSIFLEQHFRKHAQRVGGVVLEMLQRERCGELVNHEHVKTAVELFSMMSSDGLSSMNSVLLMKPYISQTMHFYEARAREWTASLTPSAYLVKVQQHLAEEKARCVAYFSPTDERAIADHVEDVLLYSQAAREKLLWSANGFAAVLKQRDEDDARRYFSLFARSTVGLRDLAQIVRCQLLLEGEELVKSYSGFEAEVNCNSCVIDFLSLQDDYTQMLSHCFSVNPVIAKGIKESLERVYGLGIEVTDGAGRQCVIPFAELLSTYVDSIVRGGEDGADEKLEQAAAALTYVVDKDTFQAHYRELLAKRLLNPFVKGMDTAEGVFFQRLRQRFGAPFVSHFIGMINDCQKSETMAEDFARRIQPRPPFELSVNVLNTGIWPRLPTHPQLHVPREVGEVLERFERFFRSGPSPRVLVWLHNMSHATVVGTFAKGRKELQVTAHQCCILLVLNERQFITPGALVTQCGIGMDDLRRIIPTLVRQKILLRMSSELTLQESDAISVNSDFAPPGRKVRVPQTLAKMNLAASERIARQVEEDRKPTVDACLVRIMKSRRVVSHAALVEECHQQLLGRFSVDPKMVKQRIEELIRRDYIERDPRDSSKYKYMA